MYCHIILEIWCDFKCAGSQIDGALAINIFLIQEHLEVHTTIQVQARELSIEPGSISKHSHLIYSINMKKVYINVLLMKVTYQTTQYISRLYLFLHIPKCKPLLSHLVICVNTYMSQIHSTKTLPDSDFIGLTTHHITSTKSFSASPKYEFHTISSCLLCRFIYLIKTNTTAMSVSHLWIRTTYHKTQCNIRSNPFCIKAQTLMPHTSSSCLLCKYIYMSLNTQQNSSLC